MTPSAPMPAPPPEKKAEFDPGMPTQVALESLEGFLSSTPKADNILINLATLVRNRMRKDALSDTVRAEAMQDAVNLARAVSQSVGLPRAMLLFYLTDYHAVAPKALIREPTEAKATYYTALGAMRQELVRHKPAPVQMNNVIVHWEYIHPQAQSYRSLADYVLRQKNTHAVVMLSHVPCDYHVLERVPYFALIRSFTGELCTHLELGRVVFDHPEMPFNVYTHSVLGDKETFKSSLSIAERRAMFELAEQEQWLHHTAQFVRDRMRQKGFFTTGSYPLVGRM